MISDDARQFIERAADMAIAGDRAVVVTALSNGDYIISVPGEESLTEMAADAANHAHPGTSVTRQLMVVPDTVLKRIGTRESSPMLTAPDGLVVHVFTMPGLS
jgi:hypothetical protein